MKQSYLVTLFLLLAPTFLSAQAISINTDASNPDPSAILDVKSTDKGMLVPRMTSAQRTAITTPATGLLVFDTDTGGFWFYNGTVWANLSAGGGGGSYSAGPGISIVGSTISNTGDTNASNDITIGSAAGGSLSGTYPNPAIATGAVGTVELAANSIISSKIADGAVTGDDIAPATITAVNLATNSITTAKINDDAVTSAKIADGTITSADIANGAIATADLAFSSLPPSGPAGGSLSGAYPNPGIAANAVGSAEIADGSITGTDIGAATITGSNLAPGVIPSALPPSGPAGGDLSGTYPNPTVAANAIGSSKIADGSIAAADLGQMGAGTGQVLKWNGTAWAPAGSINTLLQDADGNTKVQVEKFANEDVIRFDLGGTESMVLRKNASGVPRLELSTGLGNTFVGRDAGSANTTGLFNTGNGYSALQNNTTGGGNTANGFNALYSNTTGTNNTANGTSALSSNTTGDRNTANGRQALQNNTTGSNNTANGTYALQNNTTGGANTAHGASALYSNTTGYNNTAMGTDALNNNTTGDENTATGYFALFSNTTGTNNTANGTYALSSNTTGGGNTANGRQALYVNTTGSSNTANGTYALQNNTTGGDNTANGRQALQNNTTGHSNTANGTYALEINTTGNYNTASGYGALYSNTIGVDNTASGSGAMYSNVSGNGNTATGIDALRNNTSGSNNTANGNQALFAGTIGVGNTAVGVFSLFQTTQGNFNTAIGYNTGPNNGAYANTTCLGTDATATGSDMVRVGNTFVTSIGGKVGWTTLSDGRVKENVEANVPGLAFVAKLRPVTYRVNRGAVDDFTGVSQRRSTGTGQNSAEAAALTGAPLSETTTGFIAQEVEKAAADLGFDFSGVDKPKNERDLYGLRYAEFVVPLVKAVQEQQTVIEAQVGKMEKLETQNAALKAQLDTQATLLQKITATLQTAGIGIQEK